MTIEQIFQILKIDYKKEHKFHPDRRWRVDYMFQSKSGQHVAVEYEGIFSAKSRHISISGFSGDCEKYNELSIMGYIVLRFTAPMLRSGLAFTQIERIYNMKGGVADREKKE